MRGHQERAARTPSLHRPLHPQCLLCRFASRTTRIRSLFKEPSGQTLRKIKPCRYVPTITLRPAGALRRNCRSSSREVMAPLYSMWESPFCTRDPASFERSYDDELHASEPIRGSTFSANHPTPFRLASRPTKSTYRPTSPDSSSHSTVQKRPCKRHRTREPLLALTAFCRIVRIRDYRDSFSVHILTPRARYRR